MPNDVTSVISRFTAILTSAPCARLDYWVGGFHVTGTGLATIARAINIGSSSNSMGVGITFETMEPGVAASYDVHTNNIVVPSASYATSDRFEKITIVHEAIHALRDLGG